jgi:hypothetical protein
MEKIRMSDQDSSLITAAPAAEANAGPSAEWFTAHRTTPEQLENARWVESRNNDIMANRALKQTLDELGPGSYQSYRRQLESLSTEDRLDLIDKSPEELTAHLNTLAEAERTKAKQAEEAEDAARAEREASLERTETPQLREVRHAMKAAYDRVSTLDAQIAELQQLNAMREGIAHPNWDAVDADTWRIAREGKLESFDGEITALISQKQAALAEAALHQGVYHEGARASRLERLDGEIVNLARQSAPIGQIVGNDGKPTQISRADIQALVQLERDQQNFAQQAAETSRRYPDWKDAAHLASRAGVDVTPGQAQFIMTLPNGPDVAYHLAKNLAETRALAQMSNHEAARELIRISHQLAAKSAPTAPQKTNAPKPPSPVGGSSSKAFSVSDESLSADEWFRQRNADLKSRGKY